MRTLTAWMPIVVAGLIVVCVVGILRACSRLIMQNLRENTRMRVVFTDEDDEENQNDDEEWVNIPPADKIASYGLNHIGDYVTRLVQPSSLKGSLIIASPDGKKACLVKRDENQLKILESVHRVPSARIADSPYHSPSGLSRLFLKLLNFPTDAPEPKKEQSLLKLFAELQIAPDEDIVHEYNGYADAMRDLRYPIGNDINQATIIIQRLLREVYHVQGADGLHFTFME